MIIGTYLVERKDNKNNWHLIESSENRDEKFFELGKNTKEKLNNYFNDPIVKMKNISYKSIDKIKISNTQNLSDFYDKLDDQNISPLSKFYIKEIIETVESVEFQSFDKISNYLIGKHKEIFLNSIEELLKCPITDDLYANGDKVTSICDILSNHQYLDVVEGEFTSNDLENMRMILIS